MNETFDLGPVHDQHNRLYLKEFLNGGAVNVQTVALETLTQRYQLLAPHLDERQRRLE